MFKTEIRNYIAQRKTSSCENVDLKNVFNYIFNKNIDRTILRNIFQTINFIITQFMSYSNKNA